MVGREYDPDIQRALDAFRDLRDRWTAVRRENVFTAEMRLTLFKLQTVAFGTVPNAEQHVVRNRAALGDDGSYEQRSRALQKLDHKAILWRDERAAIAGYIPDWKLDSYLSYAKKRLGRRRRRKLPTPAPLSEETPITNLCSRLSVAGNIRRQRDVGTECDARIRVIDAVLVVLANCFIDPTEVRFDLSYSLAVGIAA